MELLQFRHSSRETPLNRQYFRFVNAFESQFLCVRFPHLALIGDLLMKKILSGMLAGASVVAVGAAHGADLSAPFANAPLAPA
jgi:hypothetical protein